MERQRRGAVALGGRTDRVIFQVNGGLGTARYINDLNSLGGQDAVFDSTGQLHALPVLGWYVAYEHAVILTDLLKKLNARGSIIWSYVMVDNVEAQAGDAYEHQPARGQRHRLAEPATGSRTGTFGMRRISGASGSSSRSRSCFTVF